MQEKRKFRVQTLSSGITHRDMFWLTAIIIVVSLSLYFGDIIAKNTSNNVNQNEEPKTDNVFGLIFIGCVRLYANPIALSNLRNADPLDVLGCVNDSGYTAFNSGVELNNNAQTAIISNCLWAYYWSDFTIEEDILNCATRDIEWAQIVSSTPPN